MTIENEVMEVHTANANHLLAATAMTINDTETQKILKSYEELCRKIMLYVPPVHLHGNPPSTSVTLMMKNGKRLTKAL